MIRVLSRLLEDVANNFIIKAPVFLASCVLDQACPRDRVYQMPAFQRPTERLESGAGSASG